ncbi:MAG TPA: FHA domain-containing protein [Myxococcales bacterium]|nr:FHA domain-containing protein [Myxococcales bacterium]
MPADRPRTPRTLLIPDHLWDAFATMAAEMGTDRDALVNQAMFTFARLNGFVVASDLRAGATAEAVSAGDPGAPTSMELPNLAEYGVVRVEAVPLAASTHDSRQAEATDKVLVLYAGGRELDRVTKDRFLIGRGKHCDLIISSGKVSREHAAIVRSGAEYFIEDLGSSNGTWYDKRRINRRQIQHGDEYYICSEKLSCAFQ